MTPLLLLSSTLQVRGVAGFSLGPDRAGAHPTVLLTAPATVFSLVHPILSLLLPEDKQKTNSRLSPGPGHCDPRPLIGLCPAQTASRGGGGGGGGIIAPQQSLPPFPRSHSTRRHPPLLSPEITPELWLGSLWYLSPEKAELGIQGSLEPFDRCRKNP